SNNPAHRYYLATDPVTGDLYVSDTNTRRIYRPKSLTGAKDLTKNVEVIGGTGEQCLPFDEARCGDGGKAVEATLMSPKGIAIDKNGLIYFVDGTMIRKVDQNGIISTLLGSNDLTSARPLTCDTSMHISQVRLEWPTDLAINPMDNSIYVLDNNVVLQITENRQVPLCNRPAPSLQAGSPSKPWHSSSGQPGSRASLCLFVLLGLLEELAEAALRGRIAPGQAASSLGCPADLLRQGCSLCAHGSARHCAHLSQTRSPSLQQLWNKSWSARPVLGVGDLSLCNHSPGASAPRLKGSSSFPCQALLEGSGYKRPLPELFNQLRKQFYKTSPDENRVKTLSPWKSHQIKKQEKLELSSGWTGQGNVADTKTFNDLLTSVVFYDSEGRLTNVTFPTGVVTNLHGEMERAITVDIESSSREEDVSITSNLSSIDSFYTMVQDQLRNSYQIGYDGSLRILYASGLDSHYQTEPHVLAGTANPTMAKRNMTLPGENGQNLVEWRFRKEQAQGKVNVFGRKLRVNGRNLLSVDFDRTTKTEKIYDDHRKFLLRIAYDTSGHPTLWLPSSKLMAVNVTYSSTGQIGSIQRGTTSEKIEYDGQGRIVSRVFADGKTWSYTYLEKSMVLLLHSQRQYIFEYDLLDRLSAVTMPSVAQILYDSTRVSFTYDETAGVLKTVNLQSDGFICTIRYRQIGPLIDRQIFRFSEDGMVNARFDYSYDNSFRVTSMQGVINETPLPIDLYQFDDISGKVEQFGKFGEIQYEIFRSLMYWITIQYDNMGRVTKREIKIGPFANTTKYAYEYDVDGQLQTVYLNEKIMWRYNYDLNGNLHLLNPSSSARLTPLRYDLRDRITRLGDVQYRLDEDGFLRQRGTEIFEYSSKGLLTRVYSKGSGWTVIYRYDGLGRRVSSKTSLGQHLQFFYADLTYPTRITHVYNHSSSEITSLYYDLQGHLFAMEISSGDEFYIASDNTGTPLAVFSSNGLMLKQIQYTAYGEIYFDSNLDFQTYGTTQHLDFQLVIGFHGGLYDPLTKLVHFGERDYDILAGRWTTPDIEIWKRIGKDPAPFNLYMFRNNNPASKIHDVKDYITDVNSWLVTFGFHLHNAIPGFPVPKFDLTEPSYELVKSQQWEDIPPISGVQQQVARQAKAFLSLGKMAEVQVSRRKSSGENGEKSWLWFATVKSLIGKGVMLAVNQGKVQTNVLNIANEDCIKVAAVLNNAYYLENLHFTVEGKDTHYFIKTTSPESDLGTLRLTSGRKALENGINVTVSQSTTVVNGRTRRFADVEMQYGALALHVRYGMTLDEEKARILEQARQRALSSAWAREQQRVRDGEEGARLWTEGEKRQLLSAGKVQGYDGYYVLSVEQYPELADSANNIQFLRQSEIGKR
ncbi:TEN3 protein, partial [Horornis vulcanius]|nr:TEN3 protein [Horornis vulcanius]